MNNLAIVVGINQYWSADANLTLAVNDALDMTKWLTDKNGGNVLPDNLCLLTRPANPTVYTDGTEIPKEIKTFDATHQNLKDAIKYLITNRRRSGERFYFYFSGHGITSFTGLQYEDALVMADFDKYNPDHAITLSSIKNFFKTLDFKEQIFILDACRNKTPWQEPFHLGTYPLFGNIDKISNSSQYLLFATTSLSRAAENSSLNEKNSAFTKILLDGLKGAGTAKFYDSVEGKYHVRVNRLFEYVARKVKERKIVVFNSDPPVYQCPRSIIDYGEDFPVLATLEKSAVDEEKLEIYVTPENAWEKATIRLVSEDISYEENINKEFSPGCAPIELRPKILPMLYTVKSFARGFKSKQSSQSFSLYEPKKIFVEFSPDDGNQDLFAPWESKRSSEPIANANLTVKSFDSLAPLEIRNAAGKLIEFGQGEITAIEQSAGLYHACLVLPEKEAFEQIVELEGKNVEILLNAPQSGSRIFNELINNTDLNVFEANVLPVASPPDAAPTVRATTLLTLTAAFENPPGIWNKQGENTDLHAFSEKSPAPQESRVCIILFNEVTGDVKTPSQLREAPNVIRSVINDAKETQRALQMDYNLSQVKMRLNEQSGKPDGISLSAEISPTVSGIAQYATEAAPGNYFLSIKLPDRNAARLSISVLPDRTTLLLFHRQLNGVMNVFAYAPPSRIEPGVTIKRGHAEQLRRTELLQRFHTNNRLDRTHARQYAVDLSVDEKSDPLAVCLAGYTFLMLNEFSRLGDVSNNLIDLCEFLCDGHLLRAEYLAFQDEPAHIISEEYRKALDCGIPIFARGVGKLLEAVEKYNIKHTRIPELYAVFNNLTEDILWTAWTPASEIQSS